MYCQLYPSTLPTEEIGFGLLPTPKTMDATNEGRRLTNGKSISFKTGKRYGISLPQMARNQLLPIPTAMDSTNAENWKGDDLGSQINELLGTRSHLNPLFVEEMMGFPQNWTALPFQNGGKNLSKPMEMQ
jgi:hypothetical protein